MGNQLEISESLQLHYLDKGKGQPLVFIPGWTCTTEFFCNNLDELAKTYRVLAYDPRSQGLSSTTETGNNYKQRGEDLAAFIDMLGLENVTLIGWSCGVFDAYSYLSLFGTHNIKALICIDESPRPLKQTELDWGAGKAAEMRELLMSVTNPDQSKFMREYAGYMVKRPLSEAESNWIVAQSMKTPAHIAALLMADADLADYTGVARDIDGKIPVLQILSEDAADKAKPWLSENTPDARTLVLGGHMMFWEYPDEFNNSLLKFLASI